MSKDQKPQFYYFARRAWYEQLTKLCDTIVAKKGKDPATLFWKSYGLGMSGNISECLRQLESFQSRREFQYPISLAMLYFHQRTQVVDHEAVDSLRAELDVAEEVTKDAGLVLAARLSLFTGDIDNAIRLTEKILASTRSDMPSTPAELEAKCIEYWCAIEEVQSSPANSTVNSNAKRKLVAMDGLMHSLGDQVDADFLMAWAKSKLILKQNGEAINVLNQAIATYPWFISALSEKAILLASAGEWEQALDTAQRCLDVDQDNIDGLKLIAIHSFTQECQPHDAMQKLEDLSASLTAREPASVGNALEVAELFSCICSRHPRVLQICVRLLESVQKYAANSQEESQVLCLLGGVNVMQGDNQLAAATRAFKEAAKKDPNNLAAIEGLIMCQLQEGLYDDAEAQVELLLVMHTLDELSPRFSYMRAILANQQSSNDPKKAENHQALLDECAAAFSQRAGMSVSLKSSPFQQLTAMNPDFSMLLAVDYLSHMETSQSAALSFMNVASGDMGGRGEVAGGTMKPSAAGDGGSEASATIDWSDHSRGDGDNLTGDILPAVQSGIDLLTKVISTCPGIICPYIEMARCHSGLGNYEEASRCLSSCLAIQANCGAALLALAKVEVARCNTSAADRALEQALSSDFAIRSVPLFRLVRTMVRAQQGRLDEAISEMEQVMQLEGVRNSGPDGAPHRQAAHTDSLRLTEDDRVGAFIVYASLLSKARRLKEAKNLLAEAKVVFAGTTQEVLVLVASSQLAVQRNDFDSAIRMLDKIAEDSPTYVRAQMIKAEILLTNHRDKEGFTLCYQQLLDRDKSAKNYAMLGEAYLRILNPEAAVDALVSAYKADPMNTRLRARIGKTLVATHEYHRAVDFYEAAIRDINKLAAFNPNNMVVSTSFSTGKTNQVTRNVSTDAVSLSHDLAKLYIKLGRPESSSRVLSQVLHEVHRDLTDMRQDVTTLLLLADVQLINAPTEVLQSLTKARKIQKELLSCVRGNLSVASGKSESVEQEKVHLSRLCEKTGVHAWNTKNVSLSEQMFQEAIQHNPSNAKAMLGLAKIFKGRDDNLMCIAQCKKVILADPSDEEATVMLAESLFLGPDPDSAISPLQSLLRAHPLNYNALAKMISLLRRAGRLEEVPDYVAAVEKCDRRCSSHAGYHFCLGLYARYTNDVGKAIMEFNMSRRDELFGHDSLVHMIELYLNPDQDGAWELDGNGPIDDNTAAHISCAEKLLRELEPKAKDLMRFKVLENYCSLATRNKTAMSKVMASFVSMLDKNQDYLPAILGMATGYMIEKNQHKAMNLLKRVAKMELSQHDGEDFGKANLLLARFNVDKSKFDQAQELCQRCLMHNKSNARVWEILGLIMEKSSDYERSAECYEKAWKLEFEASAPAGYKLAFSYLKNKQYVKAIDVCEIVLAQYPDYPRIKEEILKKAHMAIRTGP